jgi:hypothetical protein
VVRFFLALLSTGRFQTVNQYFLQRGHSYLHNDRDFAVVKIKVSRHDGIYLPKENTKMTTSRHARKFTVKMVEFSDIIDFRA